ncbi:MAG: iron transporter [Flavobacteriaceae bacterium]|nr:iron transporter [Flavobacteriaceae bacterium]
MIDQIKKLGPGLLFAGAAIGVSHLVQSTKAGAEFGFGLIWALLLCNFFKYPFFLFGTKYAFSTGETLLHGYKKIGDYVLYIYLLLSIVTIFTIQAAVTIVTAGLAVELFGFNNNIAIMASIILILCIIILTVGKYKLLDNFIKIVILILTLSTLFAVGYATNNNIVELSVNQIFPDEVSGIIFLAAFMGWMPAPLDVSIWQSIWTKEKLNLNNKIKYKSTLFDFNVGYISTVFLGLCFVALGAFVMFESGQTFSNNGSEFANQLIKLYTDNLGENVKIFISIAAFTTMLSTTITCLDASPRAMSQTLILLNHKKISGYNTWILIISIITMIIFVFYESEMGALIKIATILSFITAPIYAIMNYSLVSSSYMPKKFKLSKSMKFYSISGIIFLTIFSIWYITLI